MDQFISFSKIRDYCLVTCVHVKLAEDLSVPRVAEGISGCSSLLRDVTGEALSRLAAAWFLYEMEGTVGLLALRCYSFYEVLNYLRWCLQTDGKAVVQRFAERELERDRSVHFLNH